MVVLVVLFMQIHLGAPTPALGRVASTAQMGSSREPTVRLVGPKPLRHQLIGYVPQALRGAITPTLPERELAPMATS
ncbi:MAG: hypothetical protein ACOYD1_09450 [Candidatus Nanopelagicales bacterium]